MFFSWGYAAETTSTPVEAPALELKSLKVTDSRTVNVLFSEDIDPTSIVLKISKQSDNSTIQVTEVKPIKDSPDSIAVHLEDDLEEGTSYTMTVLAVVGISGSTITDGASALKEFVTPSPLKKAIATLNAPANPNAVKAVDTPPKKDTVGPSVKEDTPTEEMIEEEIVPTEELPLTGMNPLLFFLVALPLAYIFLRKKIA